MSSARILVQQAMQMRRKLRAPQHPFFCSAPPWCIQPFFIAPVMAGETMKNLLLQARVVSRPIKSPIVGWWTEFYFFYVKLRDLDERDEFTKMLLDPEWTPAAVDMSAANPGNFINWSPVNQFDVGQIDYVAKCLQCVVDEYFRDEGDNAEARKINAVAPVNGAWYAAQLTGNSVLDSCYVQAEVVAEDVAITVGADDQIRASEIDLAMRQWEMLKQANLTTLSYDDFLAQYGITPKPEEVHRPELVRFVREWTYPANTVNPADGAPSSAVSWSVSERADKDRFFREPGFLFGVWVTRPKVYLSTAGSFTCSLNNLFTWLPPAAGIDQSVSMKHVPDNQGPMPGLTDTGGYWFDVKDLYMYGEQYLGADLSQANTRARVNMTQEPFQSLDSRKYVRAWSDVTGLFKTATEPFIDVDGIVSLQVASTLRDTTPQGGPTTDV